MIWYYDVFMEQTIQIFNYDQHEVSKVYSSSDVTTNLL